MFSFISLFAVGYLLFCYSSLFTVSDGWPNGCVRHVVVAGSVFRSHSTLDGLVTHVVVAGSVFTVRCLNLTVPDGLVTHVVVAGSLFTVRCLRFAVHGSLFTV